MGKPPLSKHWKEYVSEDDTPITSVDKRVCRTFLLLENNLPEVVAYVFCMPEGHVVESRNPDGWPQSWRVIGTYADVEEAVTVAETVARLDGWFA